MPSLTQLFTSHRHLLVLDATSLVTQVGWLRANETDRWVQTRDEAGRGIFAGTAAALQQTAGTFADIGAFVYCEGPGSLLGTRTVAMALRTWQVAAPRPVYAYQSLAVAARFEWLHHPARPFTVIADARRETWHCQTVATDGRLGALQRRPAGEISTGEWVTPEHFRSWAQPPRPAAGCSYDLSAIFPALGDEDLFRPVPLPDALQLDAPVYRKWSAQIHQAPVPPTS